MPDHLMKRVKRVAAERKTTFRALVVEALERTLDEKPGKFKLREASVGEGTGKAVKVSNKTINATIDGQRESRFVQ